MSDQDETRRLLAQDAERADALAALRKSFPPETVGKLPRVTCKACSNATTRNCDKHSKIDCKVCGNWISSSHMHLDYVGHAEVTDRLLSVDPSWSWEPLAFDADGSPLIKKGASGEWTMWGKLTVCGVTRLGVGSVTTGFDAEKQLVSDFLRNAAMRFGVALDLWAKSELESATDDTPIAGPPPAAPSPGQKARAEFGERVRKSPCRDAFKKWAKEQGFPDVPAPFTDDQLAKAVEWLDFAESAYEHDHETAGEAAQTPVQPSEGVDAPIPAPPPVSAPTAELDRDAQRAHAAAEYVKTLDPVELLAAFGGRNVTAPRTKAEQRSTLADILFLDASWLPPVTEGALPL